MNFKNELKEMLGSDGQWSSKRVITFLAFGLVSIAFLLNLIWGVTVDKNMFDGIIAIVWAGLGVVVGEHLLKKKNGNDTSKNVAIDLEESDEDELGDN
jgi:hypothetical protein